MNYEKIKTFEVTYTDTYSIQPKYPIVNDGLNEIYNFNTSVAYRREEGDWPYSSSANQPEHQPD